MSDSSGGVLPRINVDKAIAWVEKRLGIELAVGQQEAIRQACQHKLLDIPGGPGVGKATLVRSILEIFAAKGMKCVLTAPTGRAAKGLAETTERTAKCRGDSCYDNAAMERFFWSLKHEWTNHVSFHDLADARLSVFKYIETFYNPVRLHQTLNYQSPNQFEADHAPAAAA